jgi:hypothetical protein
METWQRKPDGGFVLVPAMALLRAWWAYRAGKIRFIDLRVWLASFEAVARRCGLPKGRIPRYSHDELATLVNSVGGEHIRRALCRLESEGLLTWTASRIDLGSAATSGEDTDSDEVREVTPLLANMKRRIPVPRRLLRYVAESGKPVLAATVFGHLLRCVYHRRQGVRSDGLVKASWISVVFGVDERNVKGARRDLVRLGVLMVGCAPQRVLNRFGVPSTVSLTWSEPRSVIESPPRRCKSTTKSPPPRRTGNSSFGRSENQKPANLGHGGDRFCSTAASAPFRVVRLDDLTDVRRLSILRLEALRQGLIKSTEPAFFATIVRQGLWHHIAAADEDKALRQMNAARRACDAKFVGASTGRGIVGPAKAGNLCSTILQRALAGVRS